MVTPTVTTKVNNSNYDVSADQWNALIAAVKNQGYSYIVYKSGSTYYARNGATGAVDYSSTDAATVINSAIAASSGGTVHLTKGSYSLSKTTSVGGICDTSIYVNVDNVVLEGEGAGTQLILGNSQNCMIISVYQASGVTIKNLMLDGNFENQGDLPLYDLEFRESVNCSALNLQVTGAYYDNIALINSDYCIVDNIQGWGAQYDDVVVNANSQYNVISNIISQSPTAVEIVGDYNTISNVNGHGNSGLWAIGNRGVGNSFSSITLTGSTGTDGAFVCDNLGGNNVANTTVNGLKIVDFTGIYGLLIRGPGVFSNIQVDGVSGEQYGIAVESTGVSLSGLEIGHIYTGVRLASSGDGTLVSNAMIKTCTWGVLVASGGDNCLITGSSISNCTTLVSDSGVNTQLLGVSLNGVFVGKPVWLTETTDLVADSNRVATLDWTTCNLAAAVLPAFSKTITLRVTVAVNSVGSAGTYSSVSLRQTGTTPTRAPTFVLDSGSVAPIYYHDEIVVGVDTARHFDYKITVGAGWDVTTIISVLGYQ